MERWLAVGLVGGAFLLAGVNVALVGRKRSVPRWRELLRVVGYALCVGLLFTEAFGDAAGGGIGWPLLFGTGFGLLPGTPLALLGYAVTSVLLKKWQRRGNGSRSSDVSGPPKSDNLP